MSRTLLSRVGIQCMRWPEDFSKTVMFRFKFKIYFQVKGEMEENSGKRSWHQIKTRDCSGEPGVRNYFHVATVCGMCLLLLSRLGRPRARSRVPSSLAWCIIWVVCSQAAETDSAKIRMEFMRI